MSVVNLEAAFARFSEHWTPHIVAELNGQHVKVARLLGEFDWHFHEHEDELFWVVSGTLEIQLRDQTVTLHPGEIYVVPRGVEHRPVCREEVRVVLFEPACTLNTGNVTSERTVQNPQRLI